jgi:hypothetical protein
MIVSRLRCTNAVRSHGSDAALPLQRWRSPSCAAFTLCDRAELGRATADLPVGQVVPNARDRQSAGKDAGARSRLACLLPVSQLPKGVIPQTSHS